MSYADALSPQSIEKGIWEACLAIRAQAVQLAPVDQGALRNSISVAVQGREEGFNAEGGTPAPGDAKIEPPSENYVGKVGTAIVYGPAQEYGLPERNIPAQPYLRPAGYMVRAKLGGYLTKELKKAIEDMAQKRKAEK